MPFRDSHATATLPRQRASSPGRLRNCETLPSQTSHQRYPPHARDCSHRRESGGWLRESPLGLPYYRVTHYRRDQDRRRKRAVDAVCEVPRRLPGRGLQPIESGQSAARIATNSLRSAGRARRTVTPAMPLDPPKEQFHRPTRLVDLSDGKVRSARSCWSGIRGARWFFSVDITGSP